MQKWKIIVGLFLLTIGAWTPAFSQEAMPPAPMPPMFSGASTGLSSSGTTVSPRSGYGANLLGDAMVQYDPETGSLIVITDEDTNKQIDKIVKELDKPVPQVLIKVLFLEVTHKKDIDFGAEATYKHSNTSGTDLQNIYSLFGVPATGGFYKILDEDLDVVIRAIANTSKLEVLSRPSVLARNNQLATITVGEEVPFITNSRITDTGGTINTIEYRDIGIILNVTPHITPERLVELDVSPEISTRTGDTVPISETVNAEVIAKRSASTQVVVDDGRTVVIGGMMADQATETVHKIPILGDIPLLGAAFSRTIRDKTKTELLIFLTPHVVENGKELRDISLSEKSKAELAPKAFTEKQIDKYIDNLK